MLSGREGVPKPLISLTAYAYDFQEKIVKYHCVHIATKIDHGSLYAKLPWKTERCMQYNWIEPRI